MIIRAVLRLLGFATCLGALGGIASASPADPWKRVYPFEFGNDLSVSFADGRFIASGSGGAILISDDGRTWRDRSLHHSGEYYGTITMGDFAFAADRWIAAAHASDYYAYVESPDQGETWTLGTADRYHTSLEWGNGVYVSIGKDGLQSGPNLSDLSPVTVSPSAVSWQPRQVTFGNGRFVAAAASSDLQYGQPDYVGVSTDGRNWALTALPPIRDVQRVRYLNGVFVIAAKAEGSTAALIISNEEGTAWERVTVDATMFTNVADVGFGNAQWVAVGEKNGKPCVWSSVDGRTWSEGRALPGQWVSSVAFGNGRFVTVGNSGLILSSADAITWESAFAVAESRLQFKSFIEIGDQLVGWGYGFPWTTRNGVTWDTAQIHTYWRLASNGHRLVGIGLGHGDYSSFWVGDLVSDWRMTNGAPPGSQWSSLSVANGIFFAISDSVITHSAKIYRSADGDGWKFSGELPDATTERVVYGKGRYFISAGLSLYSSIDLSTWSKEGPRRPALAFDGNRFVSVENGFASLSADGTTWSNPTQLPLGGDPSATVAVGGGWIVVTSLGRIAVSRDGTNWKRVVLPEWTFGEVYFWRDRFWVGANGGGGVMRSEPVTDPGDFVNLSARGIAGEGEDALIAGTVAAGSGSVNVLVRGVGPGLASQMTGFATDPQLTLFRAGEPIGFNDDWGASDSADTVRTTAERVGAFALKAGSKDASLLGELTEGAYTAHVGSNPSGVALVELYRDGPSASRLVNLSARGRIGSHAGEELIVGFVIPPGGAKMVLIRGAGSELAEFGVTNAATDPVLVLHDMTAGRVIDQNDNWGDVSVGRDGVRRLSELAGAFPLAEDSRSAALVAVLPPGVYTAVITDKNQAGGVALAEIYELTF